MPKPTLWKTTIEIWTDFNPTAVEIERLAREATSGNAICTDCDHELVSLDQAPDQALGFFQDTNGDVAAFLGEDDN